MMLSEILLWFTSFTFVAIIWVFSFFVFDAEILNGYVKRKLQKRFKVEE